jgi:cobalamin-dependent methionine synthase I
MVGNLGGAGKWFLCLCVKAYNFLKQSVNIIVVKLTENWCNQVRNIFPIVKFKSDIYKSGHQILC